jgi:signal transduction histidine kinase
MPGMSGMEVLESLKKKDQNIVSVVITGYATIESAVESMKKGAYDFLPKPFTPDELRLITRRALEKRRAILESERLRDEKERMRQNFVALVSHELRTPLVAVMQYIEVLSGGIAGALSDEQARIIGRMKIRLTELLSLIDRWLMLSRIEEVRVKEGFQNFGLVAVIKDAVELTKTMAGEKKVKVELTTARHDPKVNGDRGMIKEVLLNLITNGIKYNHEDGTVTVQLRDGNKYWIVDVSDTGPGIPDEELPRIGHEFYRIKREGSAAGSGLGLAIVKKIIDIHEGRLDIRSKVNEGSTFSVSLPKTQNCIYWS